MVNFAAFFNTFLGYVITLVIIVVVAAVGFIIGYNVRKALDKKKSGVTVNDEKISETAQN